MTLHTSGERRARRYRRLGLLALLPILSVLVVTFAVSASGTTATCNSAATLTGSAFEIDTSANLVVNTSGCLDWLSGGSGTSFRSGVLEKNDKATGSTDDAFGQGTSENDANPTIVSGSIPPNKSDLKAFAAYTEATPTAKFLELFWSRVQNPSGTTNMDFELNQKSCNPAANPTNCANNGSGVTPETPIRTIHDKLITYDLSKGGTVPTISIRDWTGSAWGPATVISGGSNPGALGAVNATALAATDTGGLGSQDAFTFGEAAINYNQLFPVGSGCESLGGAYLKSRSSDSFSAEIKDFIAPEPIQVTNCSSLTTSATASVTVGSPISDTATLAGATGNATGSISFNLYGPFSGSDPTQDTCTAATLVTTLGPIGLGSPNASGNYVVSSGNYTPTATGRYQWVASYTSGDTNNTNSATACKDLNEASVVNKASPSISTSQSAGGIVGTSLTDTATVSGGFSPSGTVTFNLYDSATCTGSPRQTQTLPLSGGTAGPTSGFATDHTGTWSWTAVYNGDGNNNTASSGCAAEQVTIGPASPNISTSQSAGGIVGISLSDSATVSGGFSPSGTVTFNLYDSATCTGSPRQTQTLPLSGGTAGPTSGFATDHTGTWSWTAVYNGDGNNNTASSGCAAEQVTIGPASPNISTSQSAGGIVGISLSDSATVSGGFSPSGTVTFNLYDSATCTGSPRQTQTLPLSGGTAGPTSGFATDHTGTWSWTAVYNGDGNNNTATSGCALEQVTITPANPALNTIPSPGSGTIGVTLNDSGTLSGGFNPSGTITFNLYDPTAPSCGGTPRFTQTRPVSGGTASTTGGFATDMAGTWNWTASYSGDANNNGTTSGCHAEQVTIGKADVNQATAQTLLPNDMTTLSSTFGGITGSVSFSLYGPNNSTCDAGGAAPVYSETALVSFSMLLGYTASTSNTSTTVSTPGAYKWLVVYSGDSNHNGTTSACGVERFSFDNNSSGP